MSYKTFESKEKEYPIAFEYFDSKRRRCTKFVGMCFSKKIADICVKALNDSCYEPPKKNATEIDKLFEKVTAKICLKF